MRLFVAAELPAELVDALAETSASLRATVRGNYVRPDLFHVTLAFLGDVPGMCVPDVAEAVQGACDNHEPFVTSLGALGTFGRASSAVLWQGFDKGRAQWDALARDVRGELRGAGYWLDDKGFIPHVTLMRKADVTHGVLPMPCADAGVVSVVTVFSSDLSGEHPRYEALERIEL